MDAVRNEVKTGLPTNGKFHSIKAQETINRLQRRLRARELTPNEIDIANELIKDLQNALSGKLRGGIKMSTEASVNIKLIKTVEISATQIIQALIKGGWNIRKDGNVLYLPFGDNDDFDWQEDLLSEVDFLKLAQKKENAKEIIGVGLFWNNTEIGGTLLLHPDYSISFSLTINRKTLSNSMTDVNWYIEKIVPCLETNSLGIENFTFIQI